MCGAFGTCWKCCNEREEAFEYCDNGARSGNVGYACPDLPSRPWPATDEEWKIEQEVHNVMKLAWCCSPACCVRQIESGLGLPGILGYTSAFDKEYFTRITWHQSICFPRFTQGLGRIIHNGHLESEVFPTHRQYHEATVDFNAAVKSHYDVQKQTAWINRSPYCHFVDIRIFLINQSGLSHASYEIPQALIDTPTHCDKGKQIVSTFPHLPWPLEDSATLLASLATYDSTMLDIFVYIQISQELPLKTFEQKRKFYLEAYIRLAHWRMGIGLLRSNVRNTMNNVPRNYLSQLVAKEDKLRAELDAFDDVLNAWYLKQPLEIQIPIRTQLLALPSMSYVPVPALANQSNCRI